jgi:hypothetical protein
LSRTDRVAPEFFFAELLLPLKRSSARKGIHFLALERAAESYWGPVVTRTGGLERLSAGACGGDAMLERLREYWHARGEANLLKLLPYLVALRRDLLAGPPAKAVSGGEVNDFVYPLF